MEGIKILRGGRPIQSRAVRGGTVYLLLDCSGSMGGNKIEQARKGALEFTSDALVRGYSVGLITFSSDASLVAAPRGDTSLLREQLPRLRPDGSTNMAEAIQLAATHLRDKQGPLAMVVITDGLPDSEKDALSEAQAAKDGAIDIITVGTDDAHQGFLEKLASRSDLAVMVERDQLEGGITSASRMLSGGRLR